MQKKLVLSMLLSVCAALHGAADEGAGEKLARAADTAAKSEQDQANEIGIKLIGLAFFETSDTMLAFNKRKTDLFLQLGQLASAENVKAGKVNLDAIAQAAYASIDKAELREHLKRVEAMVGLEKANAEAITTGMMRAAECLEQCQIIDIRSAYGLPQVKID